MTRLPAVLVVTLVLVAALTGCTSAEERLEQGRELQGTGQSADAARRYIQALKQDPGLEEARNRLRVTGHDAITAYLAQAAQDGARGDAIGQAESYLAADALLLGARGVQVTLPVPDGYGARRRAALDGAIQEILDDSGGLASGGQWSAAMTRLDQSARFDPSASQTAAATRARLGTLQRWASAELTSGHHRAALGLAEQGLESATRDPMHARFQAIRDEAVRRGTVTVAFLPLAGGGADADHRAFMAAVNDALELEHWMEHPLLVDPVDPRRVRRRLGPGMNRQHDERRAARLARRLSADVVVITTLDELRVDERNVREREQTTRTRSGKRVRYTRRSGTLRLRAGAGFRIIPATGEDHSRVFRVNATHSARFVQATHRGDHRKLDLRRGDADAFQEKDRLAAEQHLAHDLAARLAKRMFDEIEKRIP